MIKAELNFREEFSEYIQKLPYFDEKDMLDEVKDSEEGGQTPRSKIWPLVAAGAAGFVAHWAISSIAKTAISGTKNALGSATLQDWECKEEIMAQNNDNNNGKNDNGSFFEKHPIVADGLKVTAGAGAGAGAAYLIMRNASDKAAQTASAIARSTASSLGREATRGALGGGLAKFRIR